ncbi:MAG: tetratricopeptide repeat protein [Gammaproteobacteria bacterium]|nr:tetratricopeptide repeat protein [Gammaproteobacteria bacterium]MYJ51549.1 tetratricopeptide repeat protein [Gammaproteobacteria bacterium]
MHFRSETSRAMRHQYIAEKPVPATTAVNSSRFRTRVYAFSPHCYYNCFCPLSYDRLGHLTVHQPNRCSMPVFPPTPKKTIHFLFLFIPAILIGGCQINPAASPSDPQSAPVESGKSSGRDSPGETLSPDILHDILAGEIAKQRSKPDDALIYLSRAAYHSRDKRLILEAFHLAIQTEHYQQAADLALLLNNVEPESPRARILLADAHFRLGDYDGALAIVVDTALSLQREDIYSLRETAILLGNQHAQDVLDDFLAHTDQYSDHVEISMIAAILAYERQNWNRFPELISRTLALAPEWETPAVMKLTYMANLEPEASVTYADRHLATYPDQDVFRFQYANILLQFGLEDRALLQIREILKQNPESLEALFVAGSLQLDRNPEESRMLLEKYLQLGGHDDQAVIYLSEITMQAQDYRQALNHLYSIGTKSPYYLEARIRIGRIFEERDGPEAGVHYLDGINVRGQSELTRIVLEKDRMYQGAEMYRESREMFDEMLLRYPDDTTLIYRRGLLFATMEYLALHEEDMRRLIELEPDNAYAYNALGYVLADKTDRLDEAFELISHAMELKPNDPYITDSLGWVHFRLGNHALAIKYLTEAFELLWDAEIAAHLGEVLWVTQQYEEAEKIWNEALDDFPDHPVLNETIERLLKSNAGSKLYSTHGDVFATVDTLPLSA